MVALNIFRAMSHYDTLNVSRIASPEVIRAAYKALAQKYHPDRNSSHDAALRMKEINLAYEVLSDPDKRRRYDETLEPEPRERSSNQIKPEDLEVYCTNEKCQDAVVHPNTWPTATTARPRRKQYLGVTTEHGPMLHMYRCPTCGGIDLFSDEDGALSNVTGIVALKRGMETIGAVATFILGDPKDPAVIERRRRQDRNFKIFIVCAVLLVTFMFFILASHW